VAVAVGLRRQDDAVAARALGRLQRGPRLSERDDRLDGGMEDSDAAGDGDRRQVAVLGGDPRAHTLRHLASVLLVAGHEQHELVFAIPECETCGRRLFRGHLRAPPQHRVADRAVVMLVHLGEAIEVEHDHRERRALRALGGTLRKFLPEATRVAEPGHLVEHREVVGESVQRGVFAEAPEAGALPCWSSCRWGRL
jgi:hypothetical protein